MMDNVTAYMVCTFAVYQDLAKNSCSWGLSTVYTNNDQQTKNTRCSEKQQQQKTLTTITTKFHKPKAHLALIIVIDLITGNSSLGNHA